MELQQLCEGIGLPEDAYQKMMKEKEALNLSEMEKQMGRLTEAKTAAEAYRQLENCLGRNEEHMKMLACQLVCVCRDYDRYKEKGISDEIYFDTMKCFTRFLGECRERTGTVVFDRGWWTYRQVSMTLFRIGELEYEMCRFRGKKAISIHIPSDADFTPEKVQESLKKAGEFLEKIYPDFADAEYFCESWLLSPRLGALMKDSSNIRKFQILFQIEEDMPQDKEYMEWVFGKMPDTPWQELPEQTSLQRKVKEMLKNGENLGAGAGILREDYRMNSGNGQE